MKRNLTKQLPEQSKLQEILDYCPETGLLKWRFRADAPKEWNVKFNGKPAFCSAHNSGYLRGAINNESYLAHRIVWKLVHDEEPEAIDHINGNRCDNRIENLRASTFAENAHNMSGRPNASGVSGVYLHKATGLWHARIKKNGVTKSLGYFKNLDDAKRVREAATQEHGFSARHGVQVSQPPAINAF